MGFRSLTTCGGGSDLLTSQRLGPGSTAAPLLRGTWLHAAEQRGSTVTRHSRYRGRGPHFLMTFHLPARAREIKQILVFWPAQ